MIFLFQKENILFMIDRTGLWASCAVAATGKGKDLGLRSNLRVHKENRPICVHVAGQTLNNINMFF
jgi:hypothetical protein